MDRINQGELAKLPGQRFSYTANDIGRESLLKSHRAPEVLGLVLHAQVMLLKNLDVANGLTNGTRGVVVSFAPVRSACR